MELGESGKVGQERHRVTLPFCLASRSGLTDELVLQVLTHLPVWEALTPLGLSIPPHFLPSGHPPPACGCSAGGPGVGASQAQ